MHVDRKAFIEYSINMQNIYKNGVEYNPDKKRKVLISFDDISAHMILNKKLNKIVTIHLEEESYFTAPQDIRLNCTCFYYRNFKRMRASAKRI